MEEVRSVGGRIKVRRVLSAEEVRRVVPSGDLGFIRARARRRGDWATIERF